MMPEGTKDHEEKRGEIKGMSYGKIMTNLLIPKNARNNPRRVVSGIAFITVICFFLFGALTRSCTRQPDQTQPEQTSCRIIASDIHSA